VFFRERTTDDGSSPPITLGGLRAAVDRAYDIGLRDDSPVVAQTRRGWRRRRYVASVRLGDIDWLQPADDGRALILVTRLPWRRRDRRPSP
jgi:hypothetical protein